MKRVLISFLMVVMASGLIFTQPGLATAKKFKAKPLVKIFTEDYDLVWDATVAVMKEKGLFVHPHKKTKPKKKKGRIDTPKFRYFKIFSAKPPVVEIQYRDSYKIRFKQIEEEIPQPKAAAAPPSKPADPAAKPSDGSAKPAETASKPADESAKGKEGEATPESPPPVQTIKKVRMKFSRKFEIHNDETRKWVTADPSKHDVGYTLEYLMKAIEAKMKSEDPAKVASMPNLIVTPPVIVE
ncbi:MAG: hypothetical protein ACE5HN_07250 [Nitrospiria bacterium]